MSLPVAVGVEQLIAQLAARANDYEATVNGKIEQLVASLSSQQQALDSVAEEIHTQVQSVADMKAETATKNFGGLP